jgi:hypothetical protein
MKIQSWKTWETKSEDKDQERTLVLRTSAAIDEPGRLTRIKDLDIQVREGTTFAGPIHRLTLTMEEVRRIVEFLREIGAIEIEVKA